MNKFAYLCGVIEMCMRTESQYILLCKGWAKFAIGSYRLTNCAATGLVCE